MYVYLFWANSQAGKKNGETMGALNKTKFSDNY